MKNEKIDSPRVSNDSLVKSRELLENPMVMIGRLAAKPLKEDNDYLICEDGKLYSKKRNNFLKGKIDNVGYQVYRLAIVNPLTSKKGMMLYAHRLVAQYFLENDDPENKTYVHHKDENKLNNCKENLEWVTPSKNINEFNKNNPDAPKKKRYNEPSLLEGEVWLPIKDNPNYSISNMGRVKNNSTNKILKIDEHQKYCRVQLMVNGQKKHYYIHRLVWSTFNNDYDYEGFVIDHLDSNPKNNNLFNLEKVTHSENNKRRFL